ncbi:MAG: hypothetical protein KJI69_04520 [Patescibacteria group bacterium]|nr:hypothetical protein [Patescibacteria group bacterium]
MSFSWRERLKRAKKRILEGLEIEESQKDEVWKYIWDNIGSFCRESDEQVKLVYGDRCNIDEEVEKLYQSEFDEMTIDIVEKILERLGYKLKKKKKAKKKNKNAEQTEEQTDSDSDSDSDTDSEIAEEQQTEVVTH